MFVPNFKKSVLALSVASIVGLSGCIPIINDDETNDTASNNNFRLSGVVSKGIIVGGQVIAYPIINGVVDTNTILGQAVTGSDGKYAIDVNGYTGPVSVVVSPASDSTSKVKCDVPDGCTTDGTEYSFGDLMPLNYDLEAIVPSSTGAEIAVSITPLTHMAAAYAKELGLTSDTAALANEKVATMLGVSDVLSVEPVDVTNPEALNAESTSLASIKYGYIAASIATISNEDHGGDVSATIETLTENYVENNGELVVVEGTDDDEVVSLAEITSGAAEAMAAEDEVTSGAFSMVQNEIIAEDTEAESSTAGAVSSTTTTTVVAVDNVETAKGIVTELRTWATTIQEDFESQAGENGLSSRVDAAMDASSNDLEKVLVGMTASIVAMTEAYIEEISGNISGGTYSISDHIPADFTTGDLDLPVTGTGSIVISNNTASLSNAVVNGTNVDLSITFPTSASGTEFTVSIASSSASTNDVELLIDASSATIKFANNVTDIYADNIDNLKVTELSLDLGASLGHTATSSATNNVNFSGKLTALVLVNHTTWGDGRVVEDVNPASVKMDGKFSIDDDSFEASLSLNMANAATFTQAQPEYFNGDVISDFATYEFSSDGNTLILYRPDRTNHFVFDPNTSSVTLTRNHNDGYIDTITWETFDTYDSSTGEYTSRPFNSLSDYISSRSFWDAACNCWFRHIDNLGYVQIDAPAEWSMNGGTISATMIDYDVDEENETNWRDIDGTISMTLDLDGLPAANITAEVDRDGYQSGEGSVTLRYRDVTITANGSVSGTNGDEPDLDGSLSITTASGTLEIHPDLATGEIRGSVKVNGTVVGSIKPSNMGDALIVTYVNGDFESIVF